MSSSNVACVWGANGISGVAMLDALLEQPREHWNRIICISRRPTQLDVDDERIYFLTIDLLQASVEEIIRELSKAGGEKITHVYHFTYIEKKDEEELDRVNKLLLEKALDVTEQIAGQQIECFSLQTGYKYYGVHKGGDYLAPRPYQENAARHSGPNLYYTQEDLLKDYAERNHWKYIITRPNLIIGVSKGNFMNLAVSLALYAVIQKEKGQPLIFPGNELCWNAIVDHSNAFNNANFQIWASNNEKIGSEIFNIHNGDEVRFCQLWPKIEKYFGFGPYHQAFDQEKHIPQLSLENYMSENEDLFQRLIKGQKLDPSAYAYATWSFTDFVLGRPFDDCGDLSKARQHGWSVTTNTPECYFQCFDRLKALYIIPSN